MPVRSDLLFAGVSVAVLASTSAKAATLSNSFSKNISKTESAVTQVSPVNFDSVRSISPLQSPVTPPERIPYLQFAAGDAESSGEPSALRAAPEGTPAFTVGVTTVDAAIPESAAPTAVDRPLPDAPAFPADPIDPSAMEQVTSVTQLSDVQPTDWAYQALRSLIERYGCIAGYPDSTFQGNRALSRYEFAAGLNACLDSVFERLTANALRPEDLEPIRRLQEEFRAELATLRGRVDTLEGRVSTLEGQAFSTTAILGGELVLGLSNGFGGDPPGTGDSNTIFTYSSRLQLVTSFTGKDRLRVELSSGNFGNGGFANENVLNSLNALLSFQTDTNNQLTLGQLEYRFSALNDRVVFTLKPVGFSLSSVLTSNSPYFSDSQGSISRFGQLSPLFRIGNLDSGVGLDWLISRQLRFQFAYGSTFTFTGGGANPREGFVFGTGGHALGGQFLFAPSNSTTFGLAYIYGYTPDGRLNTFTGSRIADASGFINQPANIHALNLTFQWELSPKVIFAASGGVVGTYAARTTSGAVSTTWQASLGFRDPFGRQNGDLLGFIFGQPLRLLSTSDFEGSTGFITDGVASYHAEVFYRFRINDNLSITPGFFLVTNPGNFEDNNTIYVGALRASFRF